MKEYGVKAVQIFLTSALAGGEWSASHFDRYIPRERAAGTLWKGGWVGPRTGLDDVDLPGLELQPPCRPARSQSLYQLRHPSSTDYKYPYESM
jgi:hypothetical protein